MKYYLLFLLLAARLFAAFAPPATINDVASGLDSTKPITTSALTAYVGSVLSAPDGYLWSDGATTNRAQVQIPGARGNLAGAPVASWVGWVDVPTSNPAADYTIAFAGSAYPTATSGCGLGFNTSGRLEFFTFVPGSARRHAWNGFRAAYSGRRVWLEVRAALGTSAPVFRADGVDISSNFTDQSSGSQPYPDYLSASISTVSHQTGINWPTGIAPIGCWLNAHLTDAESEAWRITGRPPAWVAQGGSAESLITGDNSTFASDTGYWTKDAGWTISGGAASFSSASGSRLRTPTNTPAIFGFRYRVAWTQTGTGQIFIQNSGGANYGGPFSAGQNSLEFVATDSGASRFMFFASDNSNLSIDNVTFVRLGALSLPAIQPIPVVDDVTTLGGNQARLVGITPVTSRKTWRLQARTNTSGNQQLLGGSAFDFVNRHRIRSWVVFNAGSSVTVSLGDVSGGAQYASGVTAGAGPTNVALISRYNATNNLWVNSSGTSDLIHTISGQVIGNN